MVAHPPMPASHDTTTPIVDFGPKLLNTNRIGTRASEPTITDRMVRAATIIPRLRR